MNTLMTELGQEPSGMQSMLGHPLASGKIDAEPSVGVGKRRTLVMLLALLPIPRTALGQQVRKVYHVGLIEPVAEALNAPCFDAFRQGLRELGYVEGKNLLIEYRSADGRADRFPQLAAELVRLKVDVIVTRGTPAAQAAKNATRSIPIVMAAIGDPIGVGVVASLARPGGNVTGLSAFVTVLSAKRLQMLKELVPELKLVAALLNMGNSFSPPQWKEIEAGARALGIEAQLLDARKPEDFEPLFDAAIRRRAGAVIVSPDGLLQAHRRQIIDIAAKHRLPVMFPSREFVDDGGMVSYGVSYPDLYHRAAGLVDKIFKGTKPSEIPVEQPMRFELAVNLKTVAALGIHISPSLMLQVDHAVK